MTSIDLIPWPLPHRSLLSDAILDALRSELKEKVSASRSKDKMGHAGRQYELAAINNAARRYRLFIRQSLSNSEVFSVGLTLMLPEGDLVLCRYNSGHHPHRNILEKVRLPAAVHQHITTQRYIVAGLDASGFAVLRSEYNSVEGALGLLTKECNIANVVKSESQSKLFP